MSRKLVVSSVFTCAAVVGMAQPGISFGADAQSNLDSRYYVSAMYSYIQAADRRLTDDGSGGILAVGKQLSPKFNFELDAIGAKYSVDDAFGDGKSTLWGLGAALNFFPLAGEEKIASAFRGAYLLVGAAYGDGKSDVVTIPDSSQNRAIFDAGIGYLTPPIFGLSLRLDARYRFDEVSHGLSGRNDGGHSGFSEPVFSAGILVPIGRKATPQQQPVAVAIVPPSTACSDGIDNDGDGIVDFPADTGCTSKDDADETNSKCSDGVDNDGDGVIDFPADKGCAAAQDDDETDPCKKPEEGTKLSLVGCGVGDVIVLRGVNFEFNKDRLTANAITILTGVADELRAFPDIAIEIGGHTDSLGSDHYNDELAKRRASSVLRYLRDDAHIDAGRMTAVGYGEAQPVDSNETEEGRELNRRVELKITAGSTSATSRPQDAPQPASAESLPAQAASAP